MAALIASFWWASGIDTGRAGHQAMTGAVSDEGPVRSLAGHVTLSNVGFKYGGPEAPAILERVTLEVARSLADDVEGALAEPAPSIICPLGFDDYVIRFSVTIRVSDYVAQHAVRAVFVQRLESRYLAEGITMFYPVGQVLANGHVPGGLGDIPAGAPS